jgi:hypothetical protein
MRLGHGHERDGGGIAARAVTRGGDALLNGVEVASKVHGRIVNRKASAVNSYLRVNG